MDETPNDSGGSPVRAATEIERPDDNSLDEPTSMEVEKDGSSWGESGIRKLSSEELRAQIRRPAVWGLLVLMAAVIAVQVWLLFL